MTLYIPFFNELQEPNLCILLHVGNKKIINNNNYKYAHRHMYGICVVFKCICATLFVMSEGNIGFQSLLLTETVSHGIQSGVSLCVYNCVYQLILEFLESLLSLPPILSREFWDYRCQCNCVQLICET